MDKISFAEELEALINRHSMESESNTPDFILAGYLMACMKACAETIVARDRWYGREKKPDEVLAR